VTIRAFLLAGLLLSFVSTAGAAPGNGKLAYYRYGGLYLAAEEGSGETRVADAATIYPGRPPLWAPDGAHVAYLAQRGRPGLVDTVPAVVGADGSGAKMLAPSGFFSLGCWLDASTLVVVGDPAWSGGTPLQDLYAYGLDGSVRRLTTDGVQKSVSPQGCALDGEAVAYAQQRPNYSVEARIVRLDGSISVVTPSGASDSTPAWSPSGGLAFARFGPNPGLYVSDTSGGAARRLTTRQAGDPVWSPDGTDVLFTYSYTDYSRCSTDSCSAENEVWSAAVDGSGEHRLAGTGSDVAGGWSPDGTRVVYANGGRSIVMNPDGTCKTVLPANVAAPLAWQPVLDKPAAPKLGCADLSVASDVSFGELPLSATTQYMLTVRNQGNEPATDVTLDQPSVEDVRILSAVTSQGTCRSDTGVHCEIGSLPVGGSALVVVTIHLDGTHASVNAGVRGGEPDGYLFDNGVLFGFRVLDCTIVGSYGADTINGTPRRDHICGRFGDDRIYGNAGNDVIEGGEGADTIYGGKGRDVIYGGGGEDVILARDGQRDVIDCGPQKDVAVVDRVDVVSNCRTVYRPKPSPQHRKHA
jgi:Ca2+-binding RTX toxin-like protein